MDLKAGLKVASSPSSAPPSWDSASPPGGAAGDDDAAKRKKDKKKEKKARRKERAKNAKAAGEVDKSENGGDAKGDKRKPSPRDQMVQAVESGDSSKLSRFIDPDAMDDEDWLSLLSSVSSPAVVSSVKVRAMSRDCTTLRNIAALNSGAVSNVINTTTHPFSVATLVGRKCSVLAW